MAASTINQTEFLQQEAQGVSSTSLSATLEHEEPKPQEGKREKARHNKQLGPKSL